MLTHVSWSFLKIHKINITTMHKMVKIGQEKMQKIRARKEILVLNIGNYNLSPFSLVIYRCYTLKKRNCSSYLAQPTWPLLLAAYLMSCTYFINSWELPGNFSRYTYMQTIKTDVHVMLFMGFDSFFSTSRWSFFMASSHMELGSF